VTGADRINFSFLSFFLADIRIFQDPYICNGSCIQGINLKKRVIGRQGFLNDTSIIIPIITSAAKLITSGKNTLNPRLSVGNSG